MSGTMDYMLAAHDAVEALCKKARDLEAENQRYEKALNEIAEIRPKPPALWLEHVVNIAREALAGDTEPPDPETSPFDKPRLETVEKGIPGPWNDKTWENDNG